MIERNISLASTGSARTSGCDNQLRLGYSRNRGIYRLNITQTGEWEGMTIRALWHTERGMLFSSLVEDGKIEVPAIVTSTPGCGRLVFEGSDGTRTLTSADIKYSVAMNSGTMGDIPEPPVPAWQQLVALVEQAKDEAWQAGEDARQSAAKANEAYENTIGAKDSAVTEIRKAETDALNNVEASAGPAASAAADAAAAGAKEKTEKAIQEVKDSAVKEVKDAAAGAAARAAQSATDAASSAAEAKKTAQDIQGYYDGVQDLVTDTLRDYTGGYYRSYDLTTPALVEDGRVGHAQDDPAFQQRVIFLCLPDHPCLFHRVLSQALVGCAGATVKLLDTVEPPALVRCIPPHRKRLRETEVVSPPYLPVFRDGKRFDDVGPALVLVMVRVVPPLGEHLPRKAVPVSVEQRLLFSLRQRGQCADVARVIFQQRRVVKDGGRDKNAGAPPGDLLPVRRFHLHQLHHPRPGRCRTDKPCLHPAMPHAAGVGRGPDIDPGAGAGRAVAAHDIAVFVPGKVGQLIHTDKVERFALIVVLVLCVVQAAEVDFRPLGKVQQWLERCTSLWEIPACSTAWSCR